jgi:putative membrane protein insertion efficiency factor
MMSSTIMTYKPFLNFALLGFLIFTPFVSQSQAPTKATQLTQLFKPTPKTQYIGYLKKSNNELQATAAIVFIGYKSYLSSQDQSSCVFSPSCSVYAVETIQSDSPVKAYLKVFDRLTRCHPLSARGEYPYYKNTPLLYDPVH